MLAARNRDGQRRDEPPAEDVAAEFDALLRSPAFNRRCRELNDRINAGEPMTLEYIAAQLGLPWEFFAAALAVEALKNPAVARVAIDDTPSPPLN